MLYTAPTISSTERKLTTQGSGCEAAQVSNLISRDGEVVFKHGRIVGSKARQRSEQCREVTQTHAGRNRTQLGDSTAATHQHEMFAAEGNAVDILREVTGDLSHRR